jgi:two-component system OmpR family sensor kinase
MSLRARLLVVLAVLAVAGLAAADAATYYSLRSFLVARVDRSVEAGAQSIRRSVLTRGRLDPGELGSLSSVTPGLYIGGVVSTTTVRWVQAAPRPGENLSAPPPTHIAQTAHPNGKIFTTGAQHGSTRYRVDTIPLPGSITLLIAAPLNEVRDTLKRLLLIEALVSLGVVAAIVGVGLWLVRASLRPLVRIEQTAAAIAEGDLGRRIENVDERTEVGRLGRALNAMLGHIERAFAERTASEERLRRFVGDASHELRTPLSSVQAYAELFRRGARDRPEDLARAMAGIEREAQRMGVLVDDLLLLARLDQGRPLDAKPVDVSALAEEAVDVARTVDPDRPLELDAQTGVSVSGDAARLRQVIDNLLANVRAHTPPGTPARVRVARENGSVVVEVADEGPGVPAETAAHVFERFYRGDPSRGRDAGGSGLGLAIVAAIVEAHGGNVGLSSNGDGRGATFRLTLPARQDSSTPTRI